MKIALVHDWLTGMRGGEKCLEELIRLVPGADIFTLLHVRGTVSPLIESRPITTSFVQRLPLAASRYRWYLPLFPLAAESFDLSGYDLVISSSHCVAKGVITGPDTRHLCYCFTPMRYVWDQYQAYFGALGGFRGALIALAAARLRTWDVASSNRVDRFATISRYVERRIWRYYRRRSEVVYPPVDTEFFTPGAGSDDYYLVVSALAPYKRLDVVVEAAPRLGFPVKIVGTGPEERRLRRRAGKNVEFLGWLDDRSLRDAYRGCRALLFPGEEDFGLTPVEAMACGKPVVAYDAGGVTESVTPLGTGAPTGVLFGGGSPGDLVEAVHLLEENLGSLDAGLIRQRAEGFSRERFSARMARVIDEVATGAGSGNGDEHCPETCA